MTRRIRDEKKESDDAAAIVLDDDRVVSNYDKQSSSTSSSDAMMLQQEQQQQNREIQELRLQVAELQAALQQERYHRNHHLFYSVWCTLNHWLHARTGRRGCQWGGYIRVIYAVLFLYSRLWFAYDVVFLLHPVTGVIPYHATRRALDDSLHYSLFQWFPHSAWLLYVLVAQGLLCGLGLLLGVQPRLCAVGIFFFLYNMYHQNQLIYDHQDIMLRVWSFMLLLLPLDHITIYDGFGGLWQRLVPKSKNTSTTSALSSDKPQSQLHQQQQSQQTSSWPMWPFRIWQVYTVMVYSAAALGKLDSQVWVNGTAMYYVGYEDGFRGPDFIFNRLWGIKLVTWSALFLELSCFVTIWPLTTRRWTFWMVVLLHVGIELTMWMHIFQYLSVLGWFVFFVQPMDDEQQEQDNKNHNQQDKDDSTNTIQSPQKDGVHGNAVLEDVAKIGRSEMSAAKSTSTRATTIRWALQRLLHTCVAVALLSLFVIDTAPTVCCGVLPFDSWQDAVYDNIHIPLEHWRREWVTPFLTRLGLHSGVWGLFWGVPSMRNHGYTAVIRFHPNQKNNKINTNTTNNINSTQDDSVVVWTNPYSTTLWKDAFYFYLWDQLEDSPRDGFPMVVSFMEYLARRHSVPGALVHAANNKDNTNHHHDSLLYVYPNNTVASISLVVHWESGVHPREDLTLWEPARGPMIQGSECMYVLELPQVEENGNDDHDTTPATVYLEYAYNERRSYNAQSNCLNYNARADDPYHYQTKPKTKFSDWNNDRHYDRYYGSGEVEEEVEEEEDEEEEEEEERGEGVSEGEEEDEDEEDDEEADEEEEEDEEEEPNEWQKRLYQSYAQNRGEGEAATTDTRDTPRHSVKDEF